MSSFLETRIINTKVIQLYGQDVKLMKISYDTDSEGDTSGASYSSTIETKAWVMTFGGFRNIWELSGYHVDGDFSACFMATIDINNDDVVRLNDGTQTQVNEVIKHYEMNRIAYKEAILRKMSTGE